MTSVRPPGARPVVGPPALLAAVTVAAAAVGAIAGLVTAPEADRPAPPLASAPSAVLDAGGVRLTAPAGWTPGEPRFRLTGLDAEVGMADGDAAAVLAVRAPDHPSLLPAELVERAGREPAHVDARAGAGAWRYELSSPGATERMTVVAAPSTAGVVTLACLAPRDAGETCARAASTLALRRGAWLPRGARGGRADRAARRARAPQRAPPRVPHRAGRRRRA